MEAPAPFTVTALTDHLKAVLEETFGQFTVQGEISNWKPATSGHVYFNLKDANALIRAVIWRSTVQRVRHPLRDGLQVVVRGRLSVYAPRGDYQLVVDQIAPLGLGAQDAALRKLKEKLQKLGYFAPERKKPLPRFPKRLALVTSPTGAAIRDMLEILQRRWPVAEVVVVPVRVQGPGAGADIARAIQFVDRIAGIDVLLLGRGGGSSDDLSAFNDEAVAQALFEANTPTISAVGHEIDVTIADMVADRRALTPSEAAELATPNRPELLAVLHGVEARMTETLQNRLLLIRKKLTDLSQRRVLKEPFDRLRERERRLDETQQRLKRAMEVRLARVRQMVEHWAGKLESLSPLNVLARGYSLTRTLTDARLVRDAATIAIGDDLEILLEKGRLEVRVERTHERAEPKI